MASALKVGVLTFHKCINYGSYWQARCLVEHLRSRGHQAELLDHDCRCVRRAEVRCALQPKLPERTPRHELKSYAEKTRRFVAAIDGLPLSRAFSLHEPWAARDYDAIVVGSDEVWNFRHPWYGSKPIFFGDDLKTGRLVSYAASFGNHSARDGLERHWAHKLARFSAISVRDENSWHLVRGATGVEPELVIDPCLLFPSPAEAQPASAEPYALVYGHGFPSWLKALAGKWSFQTGIRLVSVGYFNDFAHEQRVAEGPIEFARLMAGARAVVTNFFHGCIFALLQRKPWATVPSDYRAIKIPDLAAMIGVQDRLIDEHTGESQFGRLLDAAAHPAVERRIAELRGRSKAYLDAALA